MHTVRSRGDGSVPPVVDENSRSCSAHGFDRSNGECEQGAVSHVALANLHQVGTGLRRNRHTTNQDCLALLTEATTIGDHAADRPHASTLFFCGGAISPNSV